MTLIIITGEIDISVGSMVGLCAATMAVCLENGLPIEAAMLIGLVVGILAGTFNGLLVAYGMLPSLVVTIGTLALYRGLALIVLEERGISGFPDWYQAIGFGTHRRHADPLQLDHLHHLLHRLRDLPAPDPLGQGALRDRQQSRGRPLLGHRRQARDPRRLHGLGNDVGARRRGASPPISPAPAPIRRPGSSCR